MYLKKYSKYNSRLMNLQGGAFNEKNYPYNSRIDVNLPEIKYLNGIFSFQTIKSKILKLNVITLGDIHYYTKNGFASDPTKSAYCPDYLENLFKKYPDLNFDVLIELPYNITGKINNMQYGVIENIRRKFSNCFNDIINKQTCQNEFPNVRFHAIDIRHWGVDDKDATSDNKYKNDLQYFIFNFQKYETSINEILYSISNIEYDLYSLKNIFNELLTNSKFFTKMIGKKPEIFTDNMMKYLQNNYKLRRYQDLPLMEIVNSYSKMRFNMAQKINDINNVYSNFLKRNLELYNNPGSVASYQNDISNFINKNDLFLTDIKTIIFDYYMFARFIKILNYKSKGKSKNIFLIAGNIHCESFLNFIESYNLIFEAEIYNNNKFSVDLQNQKKIIEYINHYLDIKINNKFYYSIREIKFLIEKFIYSDMNSRDIISKSSDPVATLEKINQIKKYMKYINNIKKIRGQYVAALGDHPDKKFVEIDDKILNLITKD